MPLRFLGLTLAVFAALSARAGGVSPYLPLHQAPELERMVERVLILADLPVMTRPIALATVQDALPAACEQDAVLCEEVRRRLATLAGRAGVGHLGVSAAASSGDAVPLPNRHGMDSDSPYEVTGRAWWQPGDHLLVSAGLTAYEDEIVPTGSVLSIGFDYAQLDLGWREHGLSPMTDSAMLLGTQAQALPSVTLSNHRPLTRLRLRYEVFYARMSESNDILFDGGITSGNPRLAGLHLSIEPVPGWSLGVNRLMQYGGGARGQDSASDLFDALFRPSRYDNTGTAMDFGNQVASFSSRFLARAPIPFAVYFEYAGEDTSTNSDVRLGNTALSAGIHFPRLGRNLDLTIEASEWQNGWYVHHIYGDGLRHEGNVLGHWGGDWRVADDGVGARSVMVRLGWQLEGGGLLDATWRTLANESYTAPDYERAHALDLRYSRPWREEYFVGGELNVGRDVFGESYSRISAFFRF